MDGVKVGRGENSGFLEAAYMKVLEKRKRSSFADQKAFDCRDTSVLIVIMIIFWLRFSKIAWD